MPITKIVSGGQTGADRGGLDAAIHCGIPHGGWCPKGRKAEDGQIPERYILQVTRTAKYLERTEKNVIDSDATIVFTRGEPTGGSLRTIEFAQKHKKPWLAVNLSGLDRKEQVERIVTWLNGEITGGKAAECNKPPKECVLNVAGSRESKNPGIQEMVAALMVDVVAAMQG